MSVRRVVRGVGQLAGQIVRLAGVAGGPLSFARLSADFLTARWAWAAGRPLSGRVRRVWLRNGVRMSYRLNRGDIQSIREVWLDECYTLPFGLRPDSLLDLGGNIGLTTLWFHQRLALTRVIVVEPDPGNAAIARENFAANGVPAELIVAAVGAADGTARFAHAADSNLGHLSADALGVDVSVIGIATVLGRWGDGPVGLVKLDIEGGERQLWNADPGWLDRVQAMIAELHFTPAENEGFARWVETRGLKYWPAGSAHRESMDFWARAAAPAAALAAVGR